MPHRFRDSTHFEKKRQPIADSFYKSKYSDCVIKRYDSDSNEDLEFQKKDIDLTLILPDRSIHISEKFRKEDYGDLLIELYSKYPDVKGWMRNSEAEFLVYFTPTKIYTINKKDLAEWFETENLEEKLKKEIFNFHSSNLYKSSRRKTEFISSKENTISIYLIQAYNKMKDGEWHTLSLTISWNDLETEGVQVKKFPSRFE